MIRLPNLEEHKKVVRAIKQAGQRAGRTRRSRHERIRDGYTVRLGLLIDGEDYGPRFEKGTWGQSGIPITLDATIAGHLPRRLQDARVNLVAEIDGTPIMGLVGRKTGLIPGEDAHTTDLLSSSAGALGAGDDAVKLGEFTEYPGAGPDELVWDYARKLPYNRNRIEIQRIPNVTVDYGGSGEFPGFLAHEPAGALLERLSTDATVGYRYRDTAYGGFVARVPKPLSRLMDTVGDGPGDKVFDWRNLPNWSRERPTPPLVRYSAVRVFRPDADGRPLYEYVAEVPFREDGSRRPHKGRTLDIPFDDASDEGQDNARRFAERRALELARMTSQGELLFPAFDPLLETDDPFGVDETHKDDDGLWDRLWGMRVDAYKHVYGGTDGQEESTGLLSTIAAYTATLLEEDRIKAPSFVGPRVARPGVVKLPRPPYGRIADDLYFEDSLAWVAAQGDDLIFYDNSNGAASVSGDDLVVSE